MQNLDIAIPDCTKIEEQRGEMRQELERKWNKKQNLLRPVKDLS